MRVTQLGEIGGARQSVDLRSIGFTDVRNQRLPLQCVEHFAEGVLHGPRIFSLALLAHGFGTFHIGAQLTTAKERLENVS